MDLAKDTTISHYKILSKIGKGGIGDVYLAQDIKLNRKVAIKFLIDEFSQDTEKLNRFIQEAQATSALNHPNILTVYEIGDTENSHFIVKEFIDGKTLREHFVSSSFSIDETLKIGVQICEALKAAHQAQIIHRDIKPENIMIRDDGYVKILDFGLAKLTEKSFSNSDSNIKTENLVKTNPGMIMGTAKYMSPKQARGNEVDARSDIFSFGIVLFEMFTGRVPFEGKSEMDTMALILRGEPISWSEISPQIPIGLEEICKKNLNKNPDRRYQSSEDLLADLKKFQVEFNSQIDSEEKTIQIEKSFIENSAESILNSETNQILLTDFINLTGDGIFDKTLKLALGITLAQSPSIDIFPETGVRNTLSLMEHSPNDLVDEELGREICRREGMKAYIKGMIANIGMVYMPMALS